MEWFNSTLPHVPFGTKFKLFLEEDVMSSILSKRKIEDVFADESVETEAGGLTRAQAEEAMFKEAMENASDIVDVDPQGARDILREHLPPWLRREAEGRLN